MNNRKRFNEIEHEVISLGAMQLDIIERLKSLECQPGHQEPTPRQRVAEEFLEAATAGNPSYFPAIYVLEKAHDIFSDPILAKMADVLERAAREQGDAI
jgi:hypothetical protein